MSDKKPSAAAMRAADAVYKSLQPHTGWQDPSVHDRDRTATIIDAEFAPMVDALRIAQVNARHNRVSFGSLAGQNAECWTNCSACVIDCALATLEGR